MNLAEGTFCGLAEQEVKILQEALKGISGNALEIGCCDGYSTKIILSSSNIAHLTSVDPMIADSMEKTLVGSIERLEENTREYGSRFHFVRETSREFFKKWKSWHIKFLFLDGDHNYEEVLFDFENFTPWLAQGGILAMHDARMSRPDGAKFHKGPSKVAEEFVFGAPEKWEIIAEAFSLVIARKK